MVRHGSHDRTLNCAPAGRATVHAMPSEKKRTGNIPVLQRRFMIGDVIGALPRRSELRIRGPRAQTILQPRRGNHEQRRQKEAEERVQPDQRDVEAAEADADPECAERTVSFQDEGSAGDDGIIVGQRGNGKGDVAGRSSLVARRSSLVASRSPRIFSA